MVEINLLPQQYRRQNEPSAWRYATYALIPLTVAALLIPEVVTFTRVGELNREIDTLNGTAAGLEAAKRESDALTAEARTLEQVTGIAEQLKAGKTYWTNDLAAFSSQLPNDSSLAVKSLTIRTLDTGGLANLQQGGIYVGKAVTREIDLSGTARSQQAVVNFLKLYENSPSFGVNFKSLQSEVGAQPRGILVQGQGAQAQQYTFSASIGIVGETPAGDAGETSAPALQPAPGQAPAAPAQGAGSVN